MFKESGMSESPRVNSTTGLSDRTARIVHFAFGASVCAAAAATHRYLAAADEATGLLAVLDHVYDLWLALGISVLLLSVGYAISQRLSIDYQNTAEKISFSFFLGTGAVGLSILFLGLCGLLRPAPVIALLGTYFVLSAHVVPELYRSIARGIRNALATPDSIILACLFLSLLALLVLRTATPPRVADELIYHLPVPQQFVDQGRVFPSFDNSLGNTPFLIHMIYAVCLLAGSDVAAKLISLMLALSSALAIYAFCTRYLTRRIAIVAIFAFFAAGAVVELAVTVRIDVSLGGMLFASTYALINYLTSKRQGWLWLSSILAGFSLGIKHTAGLWIVLLAVLYLVETIKSRQSLATVLRLGVVYAVLAFAVASPWYIKNAIWFHNPLYPFITGEVAGFGANGIRYFDSEDERKLEAHFETVRKERPDVVSARQEELSEIVASRVRRNPLRLWEFFFRPNAYLMAEPYQFPNYLFLVIPLMVLLRPDKWTLWLLAISLAFVFGVTLTSWIARYLLPAYPALTIVTAYTLTGISDRLKGRFSLARRLPEYAVASALAVVIATSVASMRYFNAPSYLAGRLSRHQFLLSVRDYRPIDFINRQLPVSAQVMTLGVQMNYGLKREYISDESWFATKWRRLLVRNSSLELVHQDLKNQGITHILYNPALFRFAARMGIEGTGGMDLLAHNDVSQPGKQRKLSLEHSLVRNWSTFTLYKEKFLEPVYSDNYGYQVLKIK